jgi:thiaminase/transcriptional activator TenA
MFERMLSANKSIIDAYCQHQFNQQLYDGSLPRNAFMWFLQQDATYLRAYAAVLEKISQRLQSEDSELAGLFKRFQEETIQAERGINNTYLTTSPRPFFSRSKATTPVIASYIKHLTDTANTGTIAEAITACYPCFLLYFKLGEQNKDRYPENNYSAWTVFYSDTTFVQSTEFITSALKKRIDPISDPVLQKGILDVFSKSASFEVAFCDAALARTNTANEEAGWRCTIL